MDHTNPTNPPAPQPRTLAAFVRDEGTGPVVVLLADGPVVMLRRCTSERVEVFRDGHIHDLADDTPATPITDLDHSTPLIRLALKTVTQQYRYHQVQIHRLNAETDGLRADARTVEAAHATQLGDVRAYAIDRYNDGEICRDGLDAFLAHFAMPAYRPRMKVTFRISGCYEVDSHDEGAVRDAAAEQIYLDLQSLDGLVDGSDEYTVTVVAVEDVIQ